MNYYLIYFLSFFGTKYIGLERTILGLKKLGLLFQKIRRSNNNVEAIDAKLTGTLHKIPLSIKCLDQAIAAWYWLNRNEHNAVLRIGVSITPLESHAWVVLEERIFVKMPSIPDLQIVAEYGPWAR